MLKKLSKVCEKQCLRSNIKGRYLIDRLTSRLRYVQVASIYVRMIGYYHDDARVPAPVAGFESRSSTFSLI